MNKMIKIRDVTEQDIWLNPNAINAVVIPSPLSPGDGKCVVFFTGGFSYAVPSEARRLVGLINTDLEER